MGENKKEVARAYLALQERLHSADGHEADLIKAKMDGMHLAFNLYKRSYRDALTNLVEEYKTYLSE